MVEADSGNGVLGGRMGKKQKREERYKRVVWRYLNTPSGKRRHDKAEEMARKELGLIGATDIPSLLKIGKLAKHKLGLREQNEPPEKR
jgi:hypothetical protein